MTIIELVDVGVLDVKDDSPFSLSFQAQDVLNPSSRTSNFSKDISLVGSDNNNKILGFLFDINISNSTFNVNKLVECNVIQNGVNVFDTANFQLLSVDENPNGEIVYTGRVTSKTTDFFTKIKNKELEDLPMPVYGKALSKVDVIGSFGNVESDLFKFIALPNDLNSTIYSIGDFKPAMFLKTYFDAIHQAAGFTYNFDEWEDLNFDRLLIPNVNKIEANEELEEANNIEYLNTSSSTYPVSSGLTTNLDFGAEIIDQNNQFNNATSTYTPNVSSRLVVEVEADIRFKMTYPVTGRPDGGSIKYELQAIIESDSYLSNKIVMADFFSGQVITSGQKNIFINKVNFQIPITAIEGVPFSDIKFKVIQSGSGQWVDNITSDPMNVPAEIEVTQISIRSINDLSYNYRVPVYLKDFVPKKVKQSDFIKSLCQMFNLVIVTDVNKPNEIKYITRDKWYDEGKEVDWTNKADISKSIRKEWIQDKQAKQINLKYKADEDSVNKAYQDNFEQTFGAYEFEFENEFNTQESDEEIIFSPTPTVFNSNSNMYLPALIDGKQNIRILIDNGEKTDGYYYIREEDGSNGTLINNYAQALHIDDPNFPTFDINFGIASMYFHQLNRPTKNNLFNLFHFRKFSQLANGRLLTMYFILNEIDVNTLELNDRIWVKDGFYNINKISNYNANGKQSTKVELITVDDGIRLDRNRIKPSVGVSFPQPWRPSNPIINIGLGGLIKAVISSKNNIIGGNGNVVIGSGNNIAAGFEGVIIGDNMQPSDNGFYIDNISVTNDGIFKTDENGDKFGISLDDNGNVEFTGTIDFSGANIPELDSKVDSVTGTGVDNTDPINPIINIDKHTIGLGNVDNTSDLDKPISTATQTALNGKVDSVTGVSGVPVNNTDPKNPIIGLQDRLPLSFSNPNIMENPKWYMDNYEDSRFVEIKRSVPTGLDSLFTGSERFLLQTDTHINLQSDGYMPIQTAIDFRSGRELRRYGASNTTWSPWVEIGKESIVFKGRIEIASNVLSIVDYINNLGLTLTTPKIGVGTYTISGFAGKITGKYELSLNTQGSQLHLVLGYFSIVQKLDSNTILLTTGKNGGIGDVDIVENDNLILTVYKYD